MEEFYKMPDKNELSGISIETRNFSDYTTKALKNVSEQFRFLNTNNALNDALNDMKKAADEVRKIRDEIYKPFLHYDSMSILNDKEFWGKLDKAVVFSYYLKEELETLHKQHKMENISIRDISSFIQLDGKPVTHVNGETIKNPYIDLINRSRERYEKDLKKEPKRAANSRKKTSKNETALAPSTQKTYYNMPTSTPAQLIHEILLYGLDVGAIPERKKLYNHSQQIEVKEREMMRRIELQTDKQSIEIELENIEKIKGSNKPAKKLFVLTLIKANEQSLHKGELIKDYVSFPLEELINIGFYKTIRSAREGFKTGMSALTSIKAKGHVQTTGKKRSSIDALEVLFTGAKIKNNQCYIYLNHRINWSFIAQYFTIIPRYYFKLPNRASDLLYYIFLLARQHMKDIEKQGYFTISFRAIQYQLQLPNEKETNKPQRDIKDVIEEAIEQIEEEHSSSCNNMDLELLPVYEENASISEYLDNGYLKISLKENFSKKFIEQSKNKDKKISISKRKKTTKK